MDEIWARCVLVCGSFGRVVPVTPGWRPGRPAGHRVVLSAAGGEQSGHERRRQTESGCW